MRRAQRGGVVIGGAALLLLATAWPWLLGLGWLYRGDVRVAVSAVGWLAVVGYAWLVLLDERAVRAVRDLREPTPAQQERLRSAFAAAGAPAVVPWLGDVPPDAPLLVAHAGRRHAVLAAGTADDEHASMLAAQAVADGFAGVRPWWRPYGLVARIAWRGPFELLLAGFRPRSDYRTGPDVGHLRLSASRSTHPAATAVAWLAAGVWGYVGLGLWAMATGRPEAAGLDPAAPFGPVAGYGVLGLLLWVALAATATRWSRLPAHGDAPEDSEALETVEARWAPAAPAGEEAVPDDLARGVGRPDDGQPDDADPDDAEPGDHARGADLEQRRSSGVVRPFLLWLVASFWVLLLPLGLAERFGWLASGTLAFQALYVLLVVPGTAGLLALTRPGRRGGPPVALRAWAVGYVAVTVLTPLLLRLVEGTGAFGPDAATPRPAVAALTAAAVLAASVPLTRHLLARRAPGPTS